MFFSVRHVPVLKLAQIPVVSGNLFPPTPCGRIPLILLIFVFESPCLIFCQTPQFYFVVRGFGIYFFLSQTDLIVKLAQIPVVCGS